jgi:DedD protein
VLVIQAFDKDGKTWCRFIPTFDDASVAPTENRPPALKPPEDVMKDVEALNAKLSPWVFVLPSWKLPSLATSMNDFLKEPPAPPGATGATAPTGAMPPMLPVVRPAPAPPASKPVTPPSAPAIKPAEPKAPPAAAPPGH